MDIEIKQYSGVYILTARQLLPVTMAEAWNFFSAPRNLQAITPHNVNFKITSCSDCSIYAGMMIAYKIQVMPVIKNNWITEITSVQEGRLFIDEQRQGPYALWHHEHHFEETGGGVLMKDIITYKLPLGFIGRLVAGRIIKNKLKKIFTFRYHTLQQKF